MKIKPSTRLFKHSLPYRLTRKREAFYNIQKESYESEREKFQEMRKILDWEYDLTYPKLTWNWRNEKHWLYTNRLDIATKLIDIWGDEIVEFEGPINDYHHEVLHDYKKAVKKSLYYQKYRYVVDYGYVSDDEHINAIRTLAIENCDTMMAQGIYGRYNRYPRIYCKSDKELLLAKLSADNRTTVKTVVTIKEIEQHG